ncbi:shikimate 5-dehydrogenase [Mycetocola sp. BIGb0189]|uniref:shikimate dehydrogenase family protein n=1 Tax=Mycetocola sp. BIGb0189 TaxID=2940604 RepID=UPI002169B3E8|nr:shikimate dehydrogenase [Mycetocola sp. BIGb0189]MCS4274966.1 shikimate 5-dehydrogenase [Mycetocola sp. BIGb0189]
MSAPVTLTADTLVPATAPTMYFIGVTTGSSSIRQVFPLWAAELGLGDAVLVGIDLPLHAPAEQYRRVVEFIKNDPLSRGALVTTHKLDLFAAARDLFDEEDPLATLMNEISSISKRDGRLIAHAKDPISSGLALDALLSPAHLTRYNPDVFVIGAGGSAIAISWYLSRSERAAHPREIIVANRSQQRLDDLAEVLASSDPRVPVTVRLTPKPELSDAIVADLPAGSVIINATGLGKDAPGSPLTNAVVFPQDAIVWDLNYRGDLIFLDQARAQDPALNVTVVDGWVYFLHGWTQVIAEVFDVTIPTSGPSFDELSRLASSTKG